MATTTPETMSRAMEGSQFIESGLINRSVPVICEAAGERRRGVKTQGLPADIQLWAANFQAASEAHTKAKPKVIPVDKDADDYLWAFALQCDNKQEVSALWNRGYENALKLCGIVALGQTVPRVDLGLAKWAVQAVTDGYTAFLGMYNKHAGRNREQEQSWLRLEKAIRSRIGKKPSRAKLFEGGEAEKLWKMGYVVRQEVFDRLKLSRKDGDRLLGDLESHGKLIHLEAENFPGKKKIPMVGVVT
jgi:hypothetical protein